MYATDEKALEEIHEILDLVEAILKRVRKDRNDILNKAISTKVKEYRRFYHPDRKEKLAKKILLRYEKKRVFLWFSFNLQALYDKYYERSSVKKMLNNLQSKLYSPDIVIDYPFLRTPSPSLALDYETPPDSEEDSDDDDDNDKVNTGEIKNV